MRGLEFGQLDVKFALVGGFAVSAQTQPRFTRDIDLVISVEDDSEAEAILHSLQSKHFTIGDHSLRENF